jgi:glycosyltransferase involved in cell wall biosynthesis
MARKEILMLLDNAYSPDMRVRKEAECLRDLGCGVTILAWDRDCVEKADEEAGGVRIRRIRTKSAYQLGFRQLLYLALFYIKVIPSLFTMKFDIIYCHDMLMLPPGLLVKALRRKTLVYDAHEIYWMMEVKKYGSPVLKAIKRIENAMIRKADSFITVSEKRAAYYKRYHHREIFIVGNYYDPVEIAPEEKKRARLRIGVPEDKVLITYIGGLHVERDFKMLVDYARRNKNVYALIAGAGYWESYVRDAAEKADNIMYLGWVNNPIEYYSMSDIIYYVLDENYEYNHFNAPNNLCLSIALKIPIIANPLGETAMIIKEYGIGSPVKRGEPGAMERAVERIMNNMAGMKDGCRRAQGVYSWAASKEALRKAVGV